MSEASTSAATSLRGRLGLRRTEFDDLEPILRMVHQYHPKADFKVVEHAYEVASALHKDQRRRSGEPYISHPVAVAGILADLGMTPSTLAAALLHDTVRILVTRSNSWEPISVMRLPGSLMASPN